MGLKMEIIGEWLCCNSQPAYNVSIILLECLQVVVLGGYCNFFQPFRPPTSSPPPCSGHTFARIHLHIVAGVTFSPSSLYAPSPLRLLNPPICSDAAELPCRTCSLPLALFRPHLPHSSISCLDAGLFICPSFLVFAPSSTHPSTITPHDPSILPPHFPLFRPHLCSLLHFLSGRWRRVCGQPLRGLPARAPALIAPQPR